ncbi:MAG TPA: FCD domain-containing protein [Thermoanaerobaculia bacterium]
MTDGSVGSDIELIILERLENSDDGIGSGNLYLHLRDRKVKASQATVGRVLRLLDHRKLTAKHSNKGRVLTAAGRRHLEELRHKEGLRDWAEGVLKETKPATQMEYLQALAALRLMEGHLARLAAEHATKEELARMRRVLDEHEKEIESRTRGKDRGLDFHDLLGAAAGNRFLQAALSMIWSWNKTIQDLWADADVLTGRSSYPDHLRIFKAIAARDGAAAERAMHAHYDLFIENVRQHFEEHARVSFVSRTVLVEGDGA